MKKSCNDVLHSNWRTKVTRKVDHGMILEMCPSHIAIHRQLSVTFWLLSNGFWVCDVFNSASITISYHFSSFFSISTTVKVVIYE